MKDPFARVRCELPSCRAAVQRRQAVPVSLVYAGARIRGLACSPACAAEIVRGWSAGVAS